MKHLISLWAILGYCLATAIIFSGAAIYLIWSQFPLGTTSQKTGMLPVANQVARVIAKNHLGGHWYNMTAQTGAKTVSMPVYDSGKYQLIVCYPDTQCTAVKRIYVKYRYWQQKQIGDTLILEP